MREIKVAQASIFEVYSEHEFGMRLKALSDILDTHSEVLSLIAEDLIDRPKNEAGRCGLSVENVFRCLWILL